MGDFIQGFLLELSLVMTVGLQSAFILKQGIRREHVIIAVLTCFIGEATLVTIGIAGMGALVNSISYLREIVLIIGIIFLVFYGVKSFYSAFKKNDYIQIDNSEVGTATGKEILLAGLAFAFLNPHVIIDTTIMGSLSAKFIPHQWIFGLGVYAAALFWYSFLGTLGASLAKPLNNPKTWVVINILIGILCLFMAVVFINNLKSSEHEHNHINLFKIFGVDDSLLEVMHDHVGHNHGEEDKHNHDHNHKHTEDGHNHNDEHIHDKNHAHDKDHIHDKDHDHEHHDNHVGHDHKDDSHVHDDYDYNEHAHEKEHSEEHHTK